MTKNFTEEQYQKIVEIGKQFDEDRAKKSSKVIDYVFDEYPDAYNYTEILDMALAIANPLTREESRDKYVEKEEKYYWTLNGLYLIKDDFDGSIIFDSYKTAFTETEIKEWGYLTQKHLTRKR